MKNQLLQLKWTFLLAFSLCTVNLKAQVWVAESADYSSSLYGVSVYAINDSVAWSWGDELDANENNTYLNTAISRTQNGGHTWENVGFPSDLKMFTTSISALSSEIAWVSMVGQFAAPDSGNYIFKTIDGGENWHPVENPVQVFLDFVYLWNENEGLAFGDPDGIDFEIYKTFDGGASWNRIQNVPNALSGEFIRTDNYAVYGDEMWVATNLGRVYHTLDKGDTWEVWSGPTTNKEASKMDVSDEGDVYMAFLQYSSSFQVWKTDLFRRNSDDSQWVKLTSTEIAGFVQDVQTIPSTHTVISSLITGSNSIKTLISYNRGESWQVIDSTARVNNFDFYDSDTGYATEYNIGLDVSQTDIYRFVGSAISGLIKHTPLLNVDLRISPNPTADLINISLSSESSADYWILLNTTSGELIEKQEFNNVSEIISTINMQKLPNGKYIVTIANKNGNHSEPIIKANN